MKNILFLVVLMFVLTSASAAQERDYGSLKGFSVGINAGIGTFATSGSSANPEIFVVGRRDENKMKVGHNQVGLNVLYGFNDELGVYITGTWGFYQESLDSQGATFNRDIGVQYNYFGLDDMDISAFIIPYLRLGYSTMRMQSVYLRNIERGTAFVSTYEGGGLHVGLGAEFALNEFASIGVDYMVKRVQMHPQREVAQPFPNSQWNRGLMVSLKVNLTNYYDY